MKSSFIKYFVYLALGLILGLGLYIFFRPEALQVETSIVKQETFFESISAEGKIRSKQKEVLLAFTSGNTTGIKIKVGEPVKRGQIITTILSENTSQLKSPIDGIISKVHKESPSPVTRGEALVEIVDPSQLEVVTELLTSDSVKLKPENLAQITGWGGDTPILGKVSLISKAGFTKVSALGVEEERTEVKIALEKMPDNLMSKLGDNFHVDVSIQISQIDEALTLPLGALFKIGDDWFTYTIIESKAVLQPVTLGQRNDQKAVILQGLKVNDRVILFPGDKVKPGILVKE